MNHIDHMPGLNSLRIARSTDRTRSIVDHLRQLDFDGAGEVLKTSRHGTVWRVPGESEGERLVVKCEVLRARDHRFKSRIGQSRLHRHWRGSRYLTSRGFSTPACYALFEGTHEDLRIETLVMEWLEGTTLLDLLRADAHSVAESHDLATSVGDVARNLVSLGRFNRDNKPSNLIVSDERGVSFLDTVAIRRCRPDSTHALARMMASLYIEPAAVGCPPRRSLAWLAVRSACGTRERARQVWAMAFAICARRHPYLLQFSTRS